MLDTRSSCYVYTAFLTIPRDPVPHALLRPECQNKLDNLSFRYDVLVFMRITYMF